MALQDANEQYRCILESQAHIWNHIFSYIHSMTLKCAVELQIPDIINRHGAPMLLSELVEALPINKDKSLFVYRLMRILVHTGFFIKEGEEGYSLTPSSRLLLKDERLSMRPYVLAFMDPVLMDPWQHMSTWFQNDDLNSFQTAHGKMIWEFASQESMLNRFINEAMATEARLISDVIVKQFGGVFEGLESVVDVGGGTGTLAKSIAEAFPSLNCICFDLPHVVKGNLDGSCKNLSYVGGDMFEAIPKAHSVLMTRILHDWNDEECIKILKRCKDAIPSKDNGGKLIILDMVVTNDEAAGNKKLETQLKSDMLMMILSTGRERTEKDWAKLFSDACYSDYKITSLPGLRSVIQVYP